jgi:hypothetical protein
VTTIAFSFSCSRSAQLNAKAVLHCFIKNLAVRYENSVCRKLDDEPDRQRRRLNNSEASATDDVCPRTGKLVDWPAHSKSKCSLETVSCTVSGCEFRCTRKDMGHHTTDSALDHLDLLVTTKTNILRTEFNNKILLLKAEHDSQVRELKSEHQNEIIHSRLSSFCRTWMERKPDALFDFVVYRENSGSTTRLLCGIPGPKRTRGREGFFQFS